MNAMKFGLRVEGLQEFDAALEDLGKRLGKSVLERSMRQAAAPMLQLAKDFSPRDDGDLEGSLKIAKVTLSDPGKAAYAQVMQATGDQSAARSALRDAYRAQGGAVVDLALGPDLADGGSTAHLVEFGTGPRYHKDGRFVGEMPAQPFLRPAFDAEGGKTLDRLKSILATEIDKAVSRRAARAARAMS